MSQDFFDDSGFGDEGNDAELTSAVADQRVRIPRRDSTSEPALHGSFQLPGWDGSDVPGCPLKAEAIIRAIYPSESA